jgi:hypothetical protein
MTPAPRRLFPALVALATLVGLSPPAPPGASACEGMAKAAEACASACCCEADAGPATAATAGSSEGREIAAARPATPGCPCAERPQAPADPESKPIRGAANGRDETARAVAVLPGFLPSVAGVPPALPIPPNGSSPRVPLYLRMARLLI